MSLETILFKIQEKLEVKSNNKTLKIVSDVVGKTLRVAQGKFDDFKIKESVYVNSMKLSADMHFDCKTLKQQRWSASLIAVKTNLNFENDEESRFGN